MAKQAKDLSPAEYTTYLNEAYQKLQSADDLVLPDDPKTLTRDQALAIIDDATRRRWTVEGVSQIVPIVGKPA